MQFGSVLEKAFFATLHIETQFSNGIRAEGTAFIFEYKTEDNTYPFLVTAKESVSGAIEGRMTFMQSQNRAPLLGKGYTLDIEHFEKLWYAHPDDSVGVSVTPFVPFVKHIETAGIPVYFHALTDHETVGGNDSSLNLGDDIVYLGYPRGLWDKRHLLPVLRRAMVASIVSLKYQGIRQFLVDGRVVSGSVGSPVFHRPSGDHDIKGEPVLLGMLLRTPSESENSGNSPSPQSEADEMGVIISADLVVATITAYLKEKGFI